MTIHLNRPHWSLKSHFIVWTVILAVVVLLVLFLIDKSVWVKLEQITIVLSFLLFAYYLLLLFHGVRFDKKEKFHFKWDSSNFIDFSVLDSYPMGFTEAGAEAGPLGLMVGFLIDIAFSIFLCFVLAFILWLGTNVVPAAVALVAIPLFFLFSRSLRYIVAQGRNYQGDLAKSCACAFYYTLLSSGWLYAVLFLAHRIAFAAGWAVE